MNVQGAYHRPRRGILAAAIIMALWTASTGQAQTVVPVRGGEHGDFTRLVLQLPEGTPWHVDQDGRTVELMVDTASVSFDLGQTFTRIPRLRVDSVHAIEGPGISVALACDCPLRVFEDLPGQVVIDVLTPAEGIGPLRAEPATAANAGRSLAERLLDETAAGRDPAVDTGWLALDRLANSVAPPPPPDNSLREEIVSDLSAAVSRAIDRGVLDQTPPPPAEPVTEAHVEPTPVPASPPDDPLAVLRAHMRVAPEDDPNSSPACLPEDAIAIPDWGDDTDFITRMGAQRSALLREFDRPDPEAIAEKVRTYLYFGFGAEARALMRAFPEVLANADILRALSRIVDGEAPPYPGRLAQQGACPTIGALWAVLADPSGGAATDLDTAALRLGFASLPAHHRKHLGPIVVDRLLALDDPETARIIRDSMARAGSDDKAPDLAVADASIMLHGASGADQPDITSTLAPESSPRALALALEHQLAQGKAPPEDLIELAGILAAENRGIDIGERLRALQAGSLTSHDRFLEAFEVTRVLGRTNPGASKQLHRELLARLAHEASDESFVASAFSERPWEEDLIPSTALALAQRLVDLGFPGHARRLIQQADGQLDAATAIMLRARSYLAEAEPDAALALLEAVTDPRADDLRAEAFAMLGEPSRPTPSMVSASGSELAADPEPEAQAAADRVASPSATSQGDTAGLLRRGQEALTSASDLRAGISALLNEQSP